MAPESRFFEDMEARIPKGKVRTRDWKPGSREDDPGAHDGSADALKPVKARFIRIRFMPGSPAALAEVTVRGVVVE